MDIFEVIDNIEIRFIIALVIIVFLLVRYVVVKIKQRNNHSEQINSGLDYYRNHNLLKHKQ